MNLRFQKLANTDIKLFSELLNVFKEVFEWENGLPNQNHLKRVLKNNSFVVFIAILDNELIGGLTVHILERYDAERPSAYIYDVAVLTKHQRKGIGKKLIETLSSYCIENNFSEAFVQAESIDSHAVDFYRQTSFSDEMNAVHFTYSYK